MSTQLQVPITTILLIIHTSSSPRASLRSASLGNVCAEIGHPSHPRATQPEIKETTHEYLIKTASRLKTVKYMAS